MNESHTEDRLRSALRAQADRVQTDDAGGLDDIRRRSARIRTRRRAAMTAAGLAVVAIAAVALPRLGDDSNDVDTLPADDTSTTTTSTTSTGASATTVLPLILPNAVWPSADGDRFSDPEAAAQSFVEDYVGIADPPLGSFRETAADAGEIDVYTRNEDGAARTDIVRSTISLAALGGYWYVVSAHSDAIVVDNPEPLGSVGDPVVVDGRGRGFEGLIVVTVRAAGMATGAELATGQVLAGGGAELEPFHLELPADPGSATIGSILLQNDTAGVGLPDFTVVPIRFTSGPGTGSQASDERTVSVFWVDAGGDIQAAERTVRLSQGILRGAIQQLLFGPFSAEREAGLASGLDNGAASATFEVTITDGVATIDFGAELPALSPGTSSAAASEAFLRQLHATVFQFDTVMAAEYRVGGSCDAFWEWLQRGCATVTTNDPGA